MYTAYFHDGSMDGDCGEAELTIKSADITWKELRKQLLSAKGAIENGWAENAKDEDAIADFVECNENVVGAWIISKKDMDNKFKIISDACSDPGGDSGAYAMQALWKGIYKAFAVKEIGKKAK